MVLHPYVLTESKKPYHVLQVPLTSGPNTVSGVFEEKVLVNRIECVPSLDSVYAALD